MSASPEAQRLGPASLDTTIQFAIRDGRTAYVVTRNVEPGLVGIIDIDTGEVVDTLELSPGWASYRNGGVLHDGTLFISLFGTTAVHAVDTADRTASIATEIEDGDPPFALAAAGGTVYIGERGGGLYAYDTSAGDLERLARFDAAVQCIEPVDGTLYVGTGPMADLYALDPETGRSRSVWPDELTGERIVKFLASNGDVLVAGSQPTGALAIIDIGTGDVRIRRADPENGKTVQTLAIRGGQVVFGLFVVTDNDRRVFMYAYDLDGDQFTRLARLPLGLAPVGLSLADDRPLVFPKQALSRGRAGGDPIVSVDGAVDVLDHRAAGLPEQAERVQSIGSYAGRPVVGGHAKLTIRNPDEGVALTGEAKAMTQVGEVLYVAIYPSALIARYTPDGGLEILKRIGHEQNRPRAIHYHPSSRRLVVGTHPSEGISGGAIATYDPEADSLTVDRNVVPEQSIGALTSVDEHVIVGSEIPSGTWYPDAPDGGARLLAWEPIDRETLWSIDLPETRVIRDLVTSGDTIVGITGDGDLFRADPVDRSIEWGASVAETGGSLVATDHGVFGATTERLYRVDPASATADTVVDGLGGDWFNWPMVAATDDALYTLADRDLLRVPLDR